MLDDMCSCEEVESGLMKWDENCPQHGRAAQYFEREWQEYRQKIKAAQQGLHQTLGIRAAFQAFVYAVKSSILTAFRRPPKRG
jgi:hypothetical protein